MYHNWLNHWFVHLTGVEKMRQTCCITTHIDFQLTPGSSDTGRLIRFSTGNLVLKSENCRKLRMLQPEKKTCSKVLSDLQKIRTWFVLWISAVFLDHFDIIQLYNTYPFLLIFNLTFQLNCSLSKALDICISAFLLATCFQPPSFPLYWGTTCPRSQGRPTQRVSATEGDSSCTRKWMSFNGWERIRTATLLYIYIYLSLEGV